MALLMSGGFKDRTLRILYGGRPGHFGVRIRHSAWAASLLLGLKIAAGAQEDCETASTEDVNHASSCAAAVALWRSCPILDSSVVERKYSSIITAKCEKTFLQKLSGEGKHRYKDEKELCSYRYDQQEGTTWGSRVGECEIDVAARFAADPTLAQQPAPRASFDCDQAHTTLEKAICSDKRLGRADVVVSRVYDDTEKNFKAKDRPALIRNQQAWQAKVLAECHVTATLPLSTELQQCLLETFELRFTDLEDSTDEESLPSPEPFADLAATYPDKEPLPSPSPSPGPFADFAVTYPKWHEQDCETARTEDVKHASLCAEAVAVWRSCPILDSSVVEWEYGSIIVPKCEKTFLRKLSREGRHRYKDEKELCSYRYDRQEGTMWGSRLGECEIDVAARFAADPTLAQQPAPRASFDCDQAHSTLEKAICSDKRLGRADVVVSRVYDDTEKNFKAKDRPALIRNQQEWQAMVLAECHVTAKLPLSPELQQCLLEAFELRFTDLEDSTDKKSLPSPDPFHDLAVTYPDDL